jgi:hypothetical protein
MAKADGPRQSPPRPLRGDVVRVRSREEILATLDDNAALRGHVFMPEMLQFCGKELPVAARAHKTCDIIGLTGTSRRLTDTVHLEDARCDGSAHGGCQAGCLLFWPEEWLEWPDEPGRPIAAAAAGGAMTEDGLYAATMTVREPGAEPVYRCQATDITQASSHQRVRDVRQYVEDVHSRNVSLWFILRSLIVEVFNTYQRRSRRWLPRWLRLKDGKEFPFYSGTGTGERTPRLHLQPGELVEVKSKDEIMATLSPENKNRGMWFDQEQLVYCGTRATVGRQVTRIVDERTGKMIKLGDCVVLDDVVCLGKYRLACPRAVTPYWREAWLRRVPEDVGSKPEVGA